MIDRARLLAGCKNLVRQLVDDLRSGSGPGTGVGDVVDREYQRASVAGRTALSRMEWAEGLYAQVAVAWVLGAVFVRFCEDNGLVTEPLLSGPGNRRAIALDHRSAYLQANPAHDDRQWLREIFTRYRALPATGEVFGDHNPIWLLSPSADGARQLVQYFQAVDPDTAEVAHDFADPDWDTRFLGDLYQDLSEHAKKTYALLQTPVFVEEFILNYTFEPALTTFGLREITAIDPTCGSGHFLLGLFARLFDRWCEAEPATNRRELAQRSLDAIGGVDLNPFAASIARFRLLLAALRAGGDTRLADAPAYRIHIAVGDSLLHADPPGRLSGTTLSDELAGAAAHGYATEDVAAARVLLSRSWHVVVGNPPYVTVKDSALNTLYRTRYETCYRQFSLGVPFTERFFQLARYDADPERAGFVGMITANSFMKREFGKVLIERWVPTHDLTSLIDTSGAYIPGHGTPTVVLFGRNRGPVSQFVRAVMGIRGEPTTPSEPEKGLVWSSIVQLIDDPGSSNDYVSVTDLDRRRLAKHPWSIGGGGAAELKELLDSRGAYRLQATIDEVGFGGITGEDNALVMDDLMTITRLGVETAKPVVEGDMVRDWRIDRTKPALWPYSGDLELVPLDEIPRIGRFLWPYRRVLQRRKRFGVPMEVLGRPWYEWRELYTTRLRVPLTITFASVTTNNHFVLDRGGKVFKQSAPIIKLPQGSTEAAHLALVGLLNSSTCCFWMKQVFHDKGSQGVNEGVKAVKSHRVVYEVAVLAST